MGTASANYSAGLTWNQMTLNVGAFSPGSSDTSGSKSTGTVDDIFHVTGALPGSVLQIDSEYTTTVTALPPGLTTPAQITMHFSSTLGGGANGCMMPDYNFTVGGGGTYLNGDPCRVIAPILNSGSPIPFTFSADVAVQSFAGTASASIADRNDISAYVLVLDAAGNWEPNATVYADSGFAYHTYPFIPEPSSLPLTEGGLVILGVLYAARKRKLQR